MVATRFNIHHLDVRKIKEPQGPPSARTWPWDPWAVLPTLTGPVVHIVKSLGFMDRHPQPKCSMVLVYLPTELGDFRANVGKYSIRGAYGQYNIS